MQTRLLFLMLVAWGAVQIAHAQILMSQVNSARTSANLAETILTPANVNTAHFGKLFTRRVDGDVFAQPLYVPGLEISGHGKHDVIFVATEHDSVYAFDAVGEDGKPLWKTSLIAPTKGISTVPAHAVNCPFIQPELGITPTPVIDLERHAIYVLARTEESGRYVQRLHALDLASGQEKFNGPVEIKAEVKGSGSGSSHGNVVFDPLLENPRAALLLANGKVYLSWASSCDVEPYHGWVMAYDAQKLVQTAVFNVTPDGAEGGIWQADTGLAADPNGNVFVATGNGDFDAASGGRDYGDSLLKLALDNKGLSVQDYFTPFDQKDLNARDADLGSQGPVLLPDQPGKHPHLLVVVGKGGVLYVLDRDHLGRFHEGSDSQIVQRMPAPQGYGAMAYWNQHVYLLGVDQTLSDYAVDRGHLSRRMQSAKFAAPAATPTVSANKNQDGIVWVLETKAWNEGFQNKQAILHAYDAANVTHELYNSDQNIARDAAGMAVRFAIPMVAHGHVYVGARTELDV